MKKRKTIRVLTLWASLAGLGASGIVGCYSTGPRHDPHADVEKGAMPSAPGTFVNEFVYRQCAKAEADDFVFYHYEWAEGGAELGPYGRRHLATVFKRLEAEAPFGIMIEASIDPKLDQARYLAITDILGQLGVNDPATRVRIGLPAAEGLFGDEAERAFGQLLSGSSSLQGNGGFGNGFGNNGQNGGFGNGGQFGGSGGGGGFSTTPIFR